MKKERIFDELCSKLEIGKSAIIRVGQLYLSTSSVADFYEDASQIIIRTQNTVYRRYK